MSYSHVIELNVGGTRFATKRYNLRKEPQSILGAMFNIDSPIPPDSEDGSYFIDRNPKRFEIILDYLRDGGLAENLSKTELTNLKTEARYFMLENLLSIINKRLDELDVYRFHYRSEKHSEEYNYVRKSYFEDVPLYKIINYFTRCMYGRLRLGKYPPGKDPFQSIGTHFVTSPDDIIIINPVVSSISVKEYIEESRNYLVAEMKRRNQYKINV